MSKKYRAMIIHTIVMMASLIMSTGVNAATEESGADETIPGIATSVSDQCYYEWDAAKDISGDDTWPSSTTNAYTWTFDRGDRSTGNISDSRFNLLTKAYWLPGASDVHAPSFDTRGSSEKATFEFVLDINTESGIIFETGGQTDGIRFDVKNGKIRGTIAEESNVWVTYDLTEPDTNRFIHVVFVVNNAINIFKLYVDGDLKDFVPWSFGDDWSGANNAGLGGTDSDTPDGNNSGEFKGWMALFRYYRDNALTSAEILENFEALSAGPTGPLPPVGGYTRWFDASQLGELADGSPVPVWYDFSGNAANATVPTGNATPTFVADAGTGTGLGALYFPANSGPADSGAFRFNRESNIRTVFSVFKGNSFLLTDSDSFHFHRPGDADPADTLWTTQHTSLNIMHGSTYVNGTLIDGTTEAMPVNLHNGFNLVEVITTDSVQANSFNKDRDSTHSGDQYQAEVIIYDRVLTEGERLQVEEYLTAKWFSDAVSSGYEAWAIANGVGEADDDDDDDGRNNFYEYALGGNPTNVIDVGVEPVLVYQNGALNYIHLKRNDNSNLVYALETKMDLVNGIWAPAVYTVVGTNEFNGEYDEVINEIPTDVPNVFIRLKITEQ